jgi:Zinc knuckle
LQHYRCHQESKNPKRANFVLQDNEGEKADKESLHYPFKDDSKGAFQYSSEEGEGGRASSNAFTVNRCLGCPLYCSQTCFQSKSKTVDNVKKMYPYPHDDTVVSHHKPGQKCFACGSEKHWVRDCKYFGAYSNQVERKTLNKEHQHYETPEYKAAYSVMVDTMPNF